jgi:hypothetical protein
MVHTSSLFSTSKAHPIPRCSCSWQGKGERGSNLEANKAFTFRHDSIALGWFEKAVVLTFIRVGDLCSLLEATKSIEPDVQLMENSLP